MVITKEGWNNFWKKFWFVVWQDQSFKGWLISLIFIFILVRFIFFPLLNLATGTTLSLAIVESCSMYHDNDLLEFNDFDRWWLGHSDNYEDFETGESDFTFEKGLNKGDILFITRAKPDKLKVGDVIVFFGGPENKPIIHRVMNIEESSEGKIFTTMGDNVGRVQFFEEEIYEGQLVGRARFKIAPLLGWVKLIFYEPLRSENTRGLCEEN